MSLMEITQLGLILQIITSISQARKGAECECHMPHKTYMGIDKRRDHSIRIPRPDHTVKFGTPNACNQCHTDKDANWAADAVVKYKGPD